MCLTWLRRLCKVFDKAYENTAWKDSVCTFNIERFLKVLCSVWLTEVFFLFFFAFSSYKNPKKQEKVPQCTESAPEHISWTTFS